MGLNEVFENEWFKELINVDIENEDKSIIWVSSKEGERT